MQLTALSPNVEPGQYSSYTLDSSPGIGISTNDIFVWINMSGTTAAWGDFSRAVFYPTIKNNTASNLTVYWTAFWSVMNVGDIARALPVNELVSYPMTRTGSYTIGANGTWTPEWGIGQPWDSACKSCAYTLYSTVHFSIVSGGSAFTPTPPPTATFTPTNTPTPPPTNTRTPTNTPTPNRGGSGTCWSSGASWPNYYANYTIDTTTIPTDWINIINDAANTWTSVTPSHFVFNSVPGTNNVVSRGYLADPGQIALSSIYASPTTPITKVTLVFSDTKTFDTSNPPGQGSHSVANIATHEFGHWLYLEDIYDAQNCGDVTMYAYSASGETKKISLESADESAINWQYP